MQHSTFSIPGKNQTNAVKMHHRPFKKSAVFETRFVLALKC